VAAWRAGAREPQRQRHQPRRGRPQRPRRGARPSGSSWPPSSRARYREVVIFIGDRRA